MVEKVYLEVFRWRVMRLITGNSPEWCPLLQKRVGQFLMRSNNPISFTLKGPAVNGKDTDRHTCRVGGSGGKPNAPNYAFLHTRR